MGKDAAPGRAERPALLAGEDALGALEITHRGEREALVVEPEGPAALRPGHLVERDRRVGHLALPDQRPGAEEAIYEGAGAAALVEFGQRPGEVAGLRKVGEDDEVRDLASCPKGFERAGGRHGTFHRPAADLRHDRV